jgi:hypothetical protein
VIGDATFPTIPAGCSNSGPPENTVPAFGANGLLGVGLFLQDCGAACAQFAIPGTYYSCSANGCRATQVALNKQLQNPVALFSTDNNGVIVQLPAIPATGAATASGSLIFGIGTQSNNGLGNAAVLTVDPNTGHLGTTFNGQAYPNSFIDTGSSVLFFGTSTYPVCPGAAAGPLLPAGDAESVGNAARRQQDCQGCQLQRRQRRSALQRQPKLLCVQQQRHPTRTASFFWDSAVLLRTKRLHRHRDAEYARGQGPYVAFSRFQAALSNSRTP